MIAAPDNDLQIREVGLPHLVRRSRLILEFAGRFHNDVRGDAIRPCAFKSLKTGFRDKVPALVGKRNSQLPGR